MAVTIEIKRQMENKLLGRKELVIYIKHPKDATPKKQDITEKISLAQQASPKNVIIYDVKSRFGTHASTAKAKIYYSWEQLEKIERTFVVARKTGVVPKKIVRRLRKDGRKKKAKMFGSLKRNLKKAKKKEEK